MSSPSRGGRLPSPETESALRSVQSTRSGNDFWIQRLLREARHPPENAVAPLTPMPRRKRTTTTLASAVVVTAAEASGATTAATVTQPRRSGRTFSTERESDLPENYSWSRQLTTNYPGGTDAENTEQHKRSFSPREDDCAIPRQLRAGHLEIFETEEDLDTSEESNVPDLNLGKPSNRQFQAAVRNPSRSLPSLLPAATRRPALSFSSSSSRRRLSLNLAPLSKSGADDLGFPPPNTEFWHKMRRDSYCSSYSSTSSEFTCEKVNAGEYLDLSYMELIITWVRQTQTVL